MDDQEMFRQVSTFSEEQKGRFGYRMVSSVAHNHWFVMLTAVKKISPF